MRPEPFIPTFSPRVSWYAKKVQNEEPFSLVRYGNGDWKLIVPNLPEWRKKTRENPKPLSPLREMWESPLGRDAMRESFLATPRDENYFPAIWHQPMSRSRGWLPVVKSFLVENGLSDLKFHDGNVWKNAVETDKMEYVITALRSQPLPVILVGLPHLSILKDYLPVEEHIETHMMLHPVKDVLKLEEKILKFPQPAIVAFCCAAVGKILVQRLFPLIGDESTLIDFGSAWDGYCGVTSRGYHKSLTPERIQLVLEGR